MALAFNIPGGSVQLSGNPILVNVTGASIPTGASNYKLLLKITSIDGVVTGGPFIDAIAPDVAGAAEFDIHAYVDQPLPVNFEYPIASTVKAYIDAAYNIRIYCGETYINSSGNPVTNWITEESGQNIQIIKGGLSPLQIGEYNDDDTTFYDEWIASGRFLTHQPDNVKVAPDQVVKLFLISPYEDNRYCDLYITGHYEDDPDGELTESRTYECELFRDGLYEFTIQPALNGIATTKSGHRLSYYGIAIVERGEGAVADSRTYYVDWTYYENENYLYAANSLGGVDVIRLTGAVKKSITTTGTEGYRPQATGASAKTPTVVVTSRTMRRKWTINTGQKEPDEMEALTDVFLSRALWLLTDGKLRPVVLKNTEQLLNDTMEDLASADLELEEAHINNYF
jgi:hypothetical protein